MVIRALVVMAVVAIAAPAHAEAPWAQGVSDEQKARAKVLLDAGNALLLERKYPEALAKYTAAIEVWDHPAIRFNMVRCLIQLQRNVEAYDNLELALKYGEAPLEKTVYEEALAYDKLLATQVSDVTITCEQPGVILTFDGQPLATCPARQTRRVSPGPHQVVGKKQGLLPKTEDLVLIGGKSLDVTIKLELLSAGARIEHRWPMYVPWTVMGSGLVIVGAGAMFQYLAREQMTSYDAIVDARCTGNCPDAELADVKYMYDGARFKNRLGVGLMVTGGAAVVTGAVMAYLNRGRTVYPESLPVVAPIRGGAAVSWTRSF